MAYMYMCQCIHNPESAWKILRTQLKMEMVSWKILHRYTRFIEENGHGFQLQWEGNVCTCNLGALRNWLPSFILTKLQQNDIALKVIEIQMAGAIFNLAKFRQFILYLLLLSSSDSE